MREGPLSSLAVSSQRVWRMRRLLISSLLSPSGSPKTQQKKRVPVLRLVSSSGNGGGSRSHRNEKSLKKFLWHKNKNQRNLFRGATAAATAAKNVVTPLLHTDQQQLLPLPMPLSLPLPLLLFSLLFLLLLPPEPRPSLLWQQQLLL